jgi:hypothetical protein
LKSSGWSLISRSLGARVLFLFQFLPLGNMLDNKKDRAMKPCAFENE